MISLTSIGVALLGGIVSFLSPCVIPLVPAYLSFLTGMGFDELKDRKNARLSEIMVPALLFVAGFTLIFVVLGASASVLGSFLKQYQNVLSIVGGVLVLVFGLFMTGIIKIPALSREARFDMGASKKFGQWSGFFLGMTFAAGWTPCIGPILGSILALASAEASVGAGVVLLLIYSIGLALPFLLVAFFFDRLIKYWGFLNKYAAVLNKVAGVILIIIGIMLATGLFGSFSTWLMGYIPAIKLNLPSL